ncbi:protein suppressor of sable-like isoform X1 [Homarus americanus]|uniref:protein suppressor of sable-like isoform X1 n=1 Tax=Homarus americanus TaxID=6706 RepID=UPI001C4643D5|nr:protein suppressor of sable-like isoform X1 [Homarus americanus]
MELCKFYMMDCCAKKDKCLYMHKDFPCKHYHTGVKCKSAEKCKFSHDHLSDAARNVLLKHIELAPKDILGDFPRLTKEAAQLVVAITEAHRRGSPMDVESIPGVMEIKGRGFKYVDKAIKRQEARMKNMHKEQQNEHVRGERAMTPELQHQQVDKLVHHKSEDMDIKSPPGRMRTPPPRWHYPGCGPEEINGYQQFSKEWVNDYHYLQKDEDMINGELPKPGASNNMSDTSPSTKASMNTNITPGSSSQSGSSGNRKLGGFMTARMPQKQRELFQRIEQQHSVHHDQDDALVDGGMDDASTSANVNWYSSDEDGDGASLSKAQGQNSSHLTSNLSPSRTPPLPIQAATTPPSTSSLTSSGRQGNSPSGTPSTTPPQKGAFSGINLDNINISSDLASVLSALKNQNAASTNR